MTCRRGGCRGLTAVGTFVLLSLLLECVVVVVAQLPGAPLPFPDDGLPGRNVSLPETPMFESVLGRKEPLHRTCTMRMAKPRQRPKILCQLPLDLSGIFAIPGGPDIPNPAPVQPELVLANELHNNNDNNNEQPQNDPPFFSLVPPPTPPTPTPGHQRRRRRRRLLGPGILPSVRHIGGFAPAAGNSNDNNNNGGTFYLVTEEANTEARMYTIALQVASFSKRPAAGQACGSADIVDVCFFPKAWNRPNGGELLKLQGVAPAPGGNIFVLLNETIPPPPPPPILANITVVNNASDPLLDVIVLPVQPTTRQVVVSFDPHCRPVPTEASIPLPEEIQQRTIDTNPTVNMAGPMTQGPLPEQRRRRLRVARPDREEKAAASLQQQQQQQQDENKEQRQKDNRNRRRHRRRLQSSLPILLPPPPPPMLDPVPLPGPIAPALPQNAQSGFQSLTAQPNGELLWTATQGQRQQDSSSPSTTTTLATILALNVTSRQRVPLEFLYRTDSPAGLVDNRLIDLMAVDNSGTSWVLERAIRPWDDDHHDHHDQSPRWEARLYETQFFSAVSTVNETDGGTVQTGRNDFQSVSFGDETVPWISPKRLILDIGKQTIGSAPVEAIAKVHQTPNRLGIVLLFGRGTSPLGGDHDDVGDVAVENAVENVGGGGDDLTFVGVTVPTVTVSVGRDLAEEILILVRDFYPRKYESLQKDRQYFMRRVIPILKKHLRYRRQYNQVQFKAQEMADYLNVTSHCPTAFRKTSLNDCSALRMLCLELVRWAVGC